MGWPIYSERLVATQSSAGWVYWTVPAGKRAVVTSVVAANWDSIAGEIYVELANAIIVSHHFQAARDDYSMSLYQVAYGLERIGCICGMEGCGLSVSGFLFDDPSGATRAPGDVVVDAPAGELPGAASWPALDASGA